MHMKRYIHNDIKPDNILLDSDKEEEIFPVLTDFGIVHITDDATLVEGMQNHNLLAATMTYAPPERLQAITQKIKLDTTPKSDVYSFSLVFLELLTRKHPWNKKFDYLKVIKGERPSLELDFGGGVNDENLNSIKRLIVACWDQSPDLRPSMQETYDSICKIVDRINNI
jgi:serine/threonine protein kinase